MWNHKAVTKEIVVVDILSFFFLFADFYSLMLSSLKIDVIFNVW